MTKKLHHNANIYPDGIKLLPAQLVSARFGCATELSRALGYHHNTVSRWVNRGGRIPNTIVNGEDTHTKLLKLAKKLKVPLTLEELNYGGYLNGERP